MKFISASLAVAIGAISAVDGGRANAGEEVGATETVGRVLQSSSLPRPGWHPNYSAGWSGGYCVYTIDPNTPSYPTQLDCCRGAYRGQISGYCLGRLPSPPTRAPTGSGGLDVYYPDYTLPFAQGYCTNRRPMPMNGGRPTYTSEMACCKSAYAGQQSGE